MISTRLKLIQSYLFPMILISSILLGGFVGYFFGPEAQCLKPLGMIFLNLIFTTIVPLIFFSVSSAISRVGSLKKLGRIFIYMAIVFLLMGVIAAVLAIVVVKILPLGQGVHLPLAMSNDLSAVTLSEQLVDIFTVPYFYQLLSHQHMLALIVFSILVGIAAASPNEKGKVFSDFLQSGEGVFMRVFSLIMYYAPVGFFSYFAVLVSDLGPNVIEKYVHIAVVYYVFSIGYFICLFTCYAYLAGKITGVKLFWGNVFLPAITAIATCSGAASIPANLAATKKMRLSAEIYETVIPLGTLVHKDGSVIGGVVKIAFLFGIFHLDFSGLNVLLTVLAVSLLVGTVMGAIPSGGMLGELLILSIYGFPPSALIAIAAISIIIDPLATLLNVTGNTVSCLLIARLAEGTKWCRPIKGPG